MGSRGTFIKEGGFTKTLWKQVGTIEGIKILDFKGNNQTIPERSNTPGTTYVTYKKEGPRKGKFDKLIVFDNNRMPIYRIDYGQHGGNSFLHLHRFKPNGDIIKGITKLNPTDKLYKQYEKIINYHFTGGQ